MFADKSGQAPYHVSEIIDDVKDSYWFCATLTKSIMDEHAPIKNRVIKNNQVPFFGDGGLRRELSM